MTRQETRTGRARPDRPALPIPLEAETLPEYETYSPGSTITDGPTGPRKVYARRDTVQPRPVFQKMPELDKSAKEISGRVVLLLKVGRNFGFCGWTEQDPIGKSSASSHTSGSTEPFSTRNHRW